MVSRQCDWLKKVLSYSTCRPNLAKPWRRNAAILNQSIHDLACTPFFHTWNNLVPRPQSKIAATLAPGRSANSSVSRSPKFISVLAGSLIASLKGDRTWIRLHVFASNCGWLTGLFAFSDAKNLLQLLWLPLIQLRPQLRERSCIHGWVPISSEKWRSCYKGLCDKYAEQRKELVFVWNVMLSWDTRY